jgi:L-Ala-D/L-Glu epimerase
MRVRRFAAWRLRVPMRSAFEHAAARRDSTDNVVCQVELDTGAVGYGDCVPRPYVTGETTATVVSALEGLPWETIGADADGFDAATELARRAADAIPDAPTCIANAARAAIETALVDAFGRATGTPLLAWLATCCGNASVPERPNLRYSAVVGRSVLADRARLESLRDEFQYRLLKMKVGFGLDEDMAHLVRVRDVFGTDVEVRGDANRAWTPEDAEAFLTRAHRHGMGAIEDPLRGETLEGMLVPLRRLREHTGVEIILDEPVRTIEEARRALESGAADAISVRVSKCGGLRRSAEISAACHALGASVQLGCQVGETAILSAAGRQLASAAGWLRWLEGSNERLKFLPEHFLTAEDLTYGAGGEGAPLSGPGLGVNVDRRRVEKLGTLLFERTDR